MKTYLNANEYTDDEGNTYREYYTAGETDWVPLFCIKEVEETVSPEEAVNRTLRGQAASLCIGKGHWVPEIVRVIFHDPATIVFWADGTKTVVKVRNPWSVDVYGHEVYDPEKGLAMAIAKKALGNTGNYYNVFRKYLDEAL